MNRLEQSFHVVGDGAERDRGPGGIFGRLVRERGCPLRRGGGVRPRHGGVARRGRLGVEVRHFLPRPVDVRLIPYPLRVGLARLGVRHGGLVPLDVLGAARQPRLPLSRGGGGGDRRRLRGGGARVGAQARALVVAVAAVAHAVADAARGDQPRAGAVVGALEALRRREAGAGRGARLVRAVGAVAVVIVYERGGHGGVAVVAREAALRHLGFLLSAEEGAVRCGCQEQRHGSHRSDGARRGRGELTELYELQTVARVGSALPGDQWQPEARQDELCALCVAIPRRTATADTVRAGFFQTKQVSLWPPAPTSGSLDSSSCDSGGVSQQHLPETHSARVRLKTRRRRLASEEHSQRVPA